MQKMSAFQLVAIMGKLHNVFKAHTSYAYDWLHDSTWNDEKPFDDRAVMISTQQQAHRRTTEALNIAAQQEIKERIQLKITDSIRNQVGKGQAKGDNVSSKEHLSVRVRRRLDSEKPFISKIIWQKTKDYGYLVGIDYEEYDGQLHTIINTHCATSIPRQNRWDIPLGNPELKGRLIVGDDSVAYRVERLLKRLKQDSLIKWPRIKEEKIQEQLLDANITSVVSLLDQPDSMIKIHGDKDTADNSGLGVPRRHRTGQAIIFRVENKLSHIAETVAQLAVPKSIRYNLSTGHTEHKLTMLSIRLKNLFGDAFEHVKKCHFCQQREAYPRLKKTSTVAAHMVTHLFHRHRVPRQRVTDNGSEFDNGRLQMVCDIIDLEHRVFIAPQNPRSDGAVEKQKAILKDGIASYVKDTTEFLSLAVVVNTVVNEATTFIPVFMVHGREAGTPEDAYLCQSVERWSSVNAYSVQMRKALKAVWTSVGVESRVDIEEWNRKAQNKIKYKTLSGTANTKRSKDNIRKLSSKLQMRYVGSHRIIKGESEQEQ
jgi:hypothetical protein